MNAASTPPDRDTGPQTAHAAAFEARVDTILPTLATKVDLADLRTEFREDLSKLRIEFKEACAAILTEMGKFREAQNKALQKVLMWVIATIIALFLAVAGVMFGMANLVTAVARPTTAHVAPPAATSLPKARTSKTHLNLHANSRSQSWY